MAKADLIEEVSDAVEMSSRKSAVIVESILDNGGPLLGDTWIWSR